MNTNTMYNEAITSGDQQRVKTAIEMDKKAIELITVVQEAQRLGLITNGLAIRVVEEVLQTTGVTG